MSCASSVLGANFVAPISCLLRALTHTDAGAQSKRKVPLLSQSKTILRPKKQRRKCYQQENQFTSEFEKSRTRWKPRLSIDTNGQGNHSWYSQSEGEVEYLKIGFLVCGNSANFTFERTKLEFCKINGRNRRSWNHRFIPTTPINKRYRLRNLILNQLTFPTGASATHAREILHRVYRPSQ